MEFNRTGVILYVINYDECVDFYHNIIGLDIMFKTESLTCMEFGNGYLMIEVDKRTDPRSDIDIGERFRTCIRMNVPNFKSVVDKLTKEGIEIHYEEHELGVVAKFFDPESNLCEFKDSTKFDQQIEDYKAAKG